MNEKSIPQSRRTLADMVLSVRETQVVLDRDLALLCGVTPSLLMEKVLRNPKRFPKDFLFQLTMDEKELLISQYDHLAGLKYTPSPPHVFTGQGVVMASTILNSPPAINLCIEVLRTLDTPDAPSFPPLSLDDVVPCDGKRKG